MKHEVATSTTSLMRFTPVLSEILPAISAPAAEVVQARHAAVFFSEMNGIQLLTAAKLITADLKLLSGLKIPTGEGFERMTAFVADTLRDDYRLYNVPLVQLAMKKCVHVLTTGKDKSYGRDLSVPDFHQVMNAFSEGYVHDADREVREALDKGTEQKLLSEEEKQNLIRGNIAERFDTGNFDHCTYVDFDQLARDGYLGENNLRHNAWAAMHNVRHRCQQVVAAVAVQQRQKDAVTSIGDVQAADKAREKLALLQEVENEIKAETARMFLLFKKGRNEVVYQTAE